ncbi:MAG: hypothetical protein ACRD3W_14480, partial [Terriglobales bacterium]
SICGATMMQIHPLIPVKKAATILGVSKDLLREKITTGEIKGERRIVGEKEKWFIYSGQLESLIDRKLKDPKERTTIDGLSELFEGRTSSGVRSAARKPSNRAAKNSAPEPTGSATTAAKSVGFGTAPIATAGSTAASLGTAGSAAANLETAGSAAAGSGTAGSGSANMGTAGSVTTNSAAGAAIGADTEQCADESLLVEPIEIEGSAAAYINAMKAADRAEPVQIDCDFDLQPMDLDQILRTLTMEFAYRLADEHQQVLILRRQLEERDEQLKQLPQLEQDLECATKTGRQYEQELADLRAQVGTLEQELVKHKRPLWKRVFGVS